MHDHKYISGSLSQLSYCGWGCGGHYSFAQLNNLLSPLSSSFAQVNNLVSPLSSSLAQANNLMSPLSSSFAQVNNLVSPLSSSLTYYEGKYEGIHVHPVDHHGVTWGTNWALGPSSVNY